MNDCRKASRLVRASVHAELDQNVFEGITHKESVAHSTVPNLRLYFSIKSVA